MDEDTLIRKRNEGHRAKLFLDNPAFHEAVERCRDTYVKMFKDSVFGPDGQSDRDAAHGRLKCMEDLITDLTRIARKGAEANDDLKASQPKERIHP
jgi:hypothetical protein